MNMSQIFRTIKRRITSISQRLNIVENIVLDSSGEDNSIEGGITIDIENLLAFIKKSGTTFQWAITPTANFTLGSPSPDTIDEESTGNSVDVTGTDFEAGMTVRIPEQEGMIFSNIFVIIRNATNLTVLFDVAGDISADKTFNIYLKKSGYETSFEMNADVDLEVISDNVSGLTGKSSSETFQLQLNEEITTLTSVTSDNGNVTINSAVKNGGDASLIDMDIDTSGAAFDETFNLEVIADGETAPDYGMALEPALAILSVAPNPVAYDDDAELVEITLNKVISSHTDTESNNVNVVVDLIGSGEQDTIIDVELDTTAADAGEAFSLRVTADGETTEYFALSVEWVYEEFDEVNNLSDAVGVFSGITNWNKVTEPTLYFEVIDDTIDRLYVYESDADRTTGISASVFYVEGDTSIIIETNSSGYGGVLSVSTGPAFGVGNKMWVHAPGFSYVETDETGDPSTELDGYEGITGWDRLVDTVLYHHFDSGNERYEVYDNATSRNARTAGDILAFVSNIDGDITEQNSSGFGGTMTDTVSGGTDGDKGYVTAS